MAGGGLDNVPSGCNSAGLVSRDYQTKDGDLSISQGVDQNKHETYFQQRTKPLNPINTTGQSPSNTSNLDYVNTNFSKEKKLKSLFLILSAVLVFASCSSATLKSEDEMQKYSYKTNEEIKEKVSAIVDAHDEFTAEQKVKIKKILQDGVDKSNELKVKLSKLAQLMLDTLMSKENPMRGEIGKIKSDMKKIYSQKEKNLIKTAKELKKIMGVSVENKKFSHEIFPYLNR